MCSCVFLSTFAEHEMTFSDYVMIFTMTNILCLCIPAVPSGSIVTIIIIMSATNTKSANIALLYTVEWLLDRYTFMIKYRKYLLKCISNQKRLHSNLFEKIFCVKFLLLLFFTLLYLDLIKNH